MANNIMINFPRSATSVIINHVQRRFMPVNVPPTATDEPPIELKPDSEYPDWLWNLRLGPIPKSSELEPGTKEYYLTLRKEKKDVDYLLKMRAGTVKKVVDKVLLGRQAYLHRMRFAALAHMEEDDAGYDSKSMENHWWFRDQVVRAREYYLPMNENKVLYRDKIEGNIKTKNYYDDPESSFKFKPRPIEKRPPVHREAIQDSKRRYRYASS